jgi:hypothetical protein
MLRPVTKSLAIVVPRFFSVSLASAISTFYAGEKWVRRSHLHSLDVPKLSALDTLRNSIIDSRRNTVPPTPTNFLLYCLRFSHLFHQSLITKLSLRNFNRKKHIIFSPSHDNKQDTILSTLVDYVTMPAETSQKFIDVNKTPRFPRKPAWADI